MSYHKFIARHDLGLLPRPYKGYVTYLYNLHSITCSYSTFAYKCRELGTDKAILLHKEVTMEQRKQSIDTLDISQLAQKRKDIIMGLQSCKRESLHNYNLQLDYIDAVITSKKQINLNFERRLLDDEMFGDYVPLFI